MEKKDINVIIIAGGEELIKGYEKFNKKIKENYPNIHLYRITPMKYEEQID